MAYPRYAPTDKDRQEISFMAAIGIPHHTIARIKGTTEKTLRKACKEELELGHVKVKAAVAGALYNKAIGGNVTAMIFYLKTQAGWKETTVNEHELSFDFGQCSDEELPVALKMFARMAAARTSPAPATEDEA